VTVKNQRPVCSVETSRGIRITVQSQYVKSHDYPLPGKFLFVYDVLIENVGDTFAQLDSRLWKIVNAHGEVEIITGPGVVGKFPALNPGQSFTYQSFCPLDTEWGTMEGHFVFQREDQSTFKAAVKRFVLADVNG
jgi:ApaG protein